MSKKEYDLSSARDHLEKNDVLVQGTAIWIDPATGPGLSCWGAIDYLTSEMGFRINPTDVKQVKFKRKKREAS
jgi:hypothetical protein